MFLSRLAWKTCLKDLCVFVRQEFFSPREEKGRKSIPSNGRGTAIPPPLSKQGRLLFHSLFSNIPCEGLADNITYHSNF